MSKSNSAATSARAARAEEFREGHEQMDRQEEQIAHELKIIMPAQSAQDCTTAAIYAKVANSPPTRLVHFAICPHPLTYIGVHSISSGRPRRFWSGWLKEAAIKAHMRVALHSSLFGGGAQARRWSRNRLGMHSADSQALRRHDRKSLACAAKPF